jgi:hypothetical protein
MVRYALLNEVLGCCGSGNVFSNAVALNGGSFGVLTFGEHSTPVHKAFHCLEIKLEMSGGIS